MFAALPLVVMGWLKSVLEMLPTLWDFLMSKPGLLLVGWVVGGLMGVSHEKKAWDRAESARTAAIIQAREAERVRQIEANAKNAKSSAEERTAAEEFAKQLDKVVEVEAPQVDEPKVKVVVQKEVVHVKDPKGECVVDADMASSLRKLDSIKRRR